MKKILPLIFLLCLFCLLLTGCGSPSADSINNTDQSGEVVSDSSGTENPFEDTTQTEVIGSAGHGFRGVQEDENGERIPFEYNGGAMELEYEYHGSGIGKKAGLLLFLNGIPQPWQINGEGESSYIQYVELKEDDGSYPFTISFIPVTGTAGDCLELKICSITNAQFQPDMVETTHFGAYHKILANKADIQFNENADGSNGSLSNEPLLKNVTLTSEKITNDFSEALMDQYGGFDTIDDLLENNMYMLNQYNDQFYTDSFNIEEETVHVKVQFCGIADHTWVFSMYANHELVSDGTDSTWTATSKKGEVVTLEADIDVDALGDLTTFYVIGCSDSNSSDSMTTIEKGQSILLYR